MPNTFMNLNRKNSSRLTICCQRGFTLLEVIVAVSIFAVVIFIIYGTFTAASNHAAIVEEKADEVSSIAGILDVMSREIRGAYLHPEGTMRNFTGKKDSITFVTAAAYAGEGEPYARRVAYIFEQGDLKRKTLHMGKEKEYKDELLLLRDIKTPSFSFFDGKRWVDEWAAEKLPDGVKVIFSYMGKDIENIIPVWGRR